MKRNYLRAMAVAAFAILAGYNVYLAQPKTNDEKSDVLVANVEALFQIELPEVVITCSASCRDGIGQCWTTSSEDERYCERSPLTTNYCSCAHLPG